GPNAEHADEPVGAALLAAREASDLVAVPGDEVERRVALVDAHAPPLVEGQRAEPPFVRKRLVDRVEEHPGVLRPERRRSNALGPLRCRRGTVQLHPHLVEVPDGFVAACGDELGSEVVACEGVEPQLQAAGLADALLSEVEQKRLEIAGAGARSDGALASAAAGAMPWKRLAATWTYPSRFASLRPRKTSQCHGDGL